jgi:voltage-gated potassium channel
LVLVLIAAGTVGFHLIQGWEWFQAFYGTLMTISTIGAEPENQLSRAGRIFNAFLILAGLGVVGFAIGSFTHAVIESELGSFFGRRKMKGEIAKLKDHFIICGVGRVGRRIALELSARKLPFVVIEKDPLRAAWAQDRGFLTVVGDATSEAVLSGVHIESAKGLASVVGSDAQNVYIVLTARGMAPNLPIVTRASEETAESKLVRAGATSVISPYAYTGQRLARLLARPKVHRFIEQTFAALIDESLDLQIEEVTVNSGSALVGTKLAEIESRFQLGVTVLAVRWKGGELKFHPKSDQIISTGDVLIALGTSAELVGLERLAATTVAAKSLP